MGSDKVSPTDQQVRNLAEDLVREQNTITFATAAGDVAWAAPVYYVTQGFNFYFFSDPNSRHIQESLKSHQASAAVFHQSSTWKEIRGVQMSGTISPVSVGMEALRAMRTYLKKFPFTEEFFNQGEKLDLAAFAKRFRVRLYRFKPEIVYYMDNRIRFGFREKIRV